MNNLIILEGLIPTKILAFSGRKQAGKDTCCDFVEKIYHRELFGTGFDGEFIQIDGKHIPLIRKYSFAYWLKFICTKILGLTHEQVYGTDEDKNSYTNLKWKNMPGILIPNHSMNDNYMTAREVLQYWGTEIFRRAYNDVWVDSTIRQIKEDQPILATISDTRFINEVKGIQNIGGKVIRLTRNSDILSSHQSETELDNYDKFDYVIDNTNLSLDEQELEVEKMMKYMEVI